MDKRKLTKRQQQVLAYIRTCIEEKHYPPSVREIGKALGLSSPSTVHAHLNALERKGYIKRDAAKSRSMVITEDGLESTGGSASSPYGGSSSSVAELPLVGRVAAGSPLLAEQNIEERISIPTGVFGDGNSFLLTVRGESMIEAGILNGDVLVVREQSTAEDGDTVVALLGDGATVKEYYKEEDCVRLQPRNSSMEPIFTREAKILGVVTGLFRRI